MAKQPKIYKIENHTTGSMSRSNRYYYQTGTLEELVKSYSYTLEVGASWASEPGNYKINRNPKSVKTLVNNLNKAVNNSAANGYAGQHFQVVDVNAEENKGS